MNKLLKIIILCFLLAIQSSFIYGADTYIFKYKPVKYLKYNFNMKTIGPDLAYNDNNCIYTLKAIEKGKIELSINISKDVDSFFCCLLGKIGWLYPEFINLKYIINDSGEIITTQQKDHCIKVLRHFDKKLEFSYPDSIFVPFQFENEPIELKKLYRKTYTSLDKRNKPHIIISKIEYTELINNDVIKIEKLISIDNHEKILFKGNFNLKKGFWEYWEFYSKSSSGWLSIYKFELIEYKE